MGDVWKFAMFGSGCASLPSNPDGTRRNALLRSTTHIRHAVEADPYRLRGPRGANHAWGNVMAGVALGRLGNRRTDDRMKVVPADCPPLIEWRWKRMVNEAEHGAGERGRSPEVRDRS